MKEPNSTQESRYKRQPRKWLSRSWLALGRISESL